ncbi:hypothetical protein ACFL3C_04185 [Patescibacteria group bacterium]
MTSDTKSLIREAIQISVGGKSLTIEDIGTALQGLEVPELMKAMERLLVTIGGEQFKLILDGFEIGMTHSAFSEERAEQLPKLLEVIKKFPFTTWLTEMGIPFTGAMRKHLCEWWDAFMLLAVEMGYIAGRIDSTSRTTNLWKATAKLAAKMQADPAAYKFLPALLINHPSEVERVLSALNEPVPFIEVLTGEAIEDMRLCPEFLGAFSTIQHKGDTVRSAENAVLSITLALQRG